MRRRKRLTMPLLVASAACVGALAALVACSSEVQGMPDAEPPCTYRYLGDPDAGAIAEITTALVPGEQVHAVPDGGYASLVPADEDARRFVVWLGMRATNVDPCGVRLEATVEYGLRDAGVVVEGVRLTPQADGWGDSMIESPVPLPVCPDLGDLPGNLVLPVSVALTDRHGKTTSVTSRTVLSCGAPPGDVDGVFAKVCKCVCREASSADECYDAGAP